MQDDPDRLPTSCRCTSPRAPDRCRYPSASSESLFVARLHSARPSTHERSRQPSSKLSASRPPYSASAQYHIEFTLDGAGICSTKHRENCLKHWVSAYDPKRYSGPGWSAPSFLRTSSSALRPAGAKRLLRLAVLHTLEVRVSRRHFHPFLASELQTSPDRIRIDIYDHFAARVVL